MTSGTQPDPADGFVLKAGDGEALLNGIVVKASPKTGTQGSILVEQTLQTGGTTTRHIHEQGDELFYVVAGRGTATLGGRTEEIEPGDAIFIPRGAVHSIQNPKATEPLKVVFFMDRPELVEQMRATHERVTSDPTRPITPEERAGIAKIGGMKAAE